MSTRKWVDQINRFGNERIYVHFTCIGKTFIMQKKGSHVIHNYVLQIKHPYIHDKLD